MGLLRIRTVWTRIDVFKAVFPHLFLVLLQEGKSFLGCPYDGHSRSLFDLAEGVGELGLGYPERRRRGDVRGFDGLIS